MPLTDNLITECWPLDPYNSKFVILQTDLIERLREVIGEDTRVMYTAHVANAKESYVFTVVCDSFSSRRGCVQFYAPVYNTYLPPTTGTMRRRVVRILKECILVNF